MIPSLKVINPNGKVRILVTKNIPGKGWLDVLTKELDARIEIDTRSWLEIIKVSKQYYLLA